MLSRDEKELRKKLLTNDIMKRCMVFPSLLVIIFFSFVSGLAMAQPDMARRHTVDSVDLYRDAKISRLFYYLPGDLQIASDSDGMPDFSLLLMRYTGTEAYDDQGTHRTRNLMQMRIIHSTMPKERLNLVKQKLRALAPDPELRPFPVKNLKAYLVYALVGAAGPEEGSVTAEGNYFSQDTDTKPAGEYWKERNFVVRLDNESANLFGDALQKQQTVLSVGYIFFADVVNSPETGLSVSGTAGAAAILYNMMRSEFENAKPDTLTDTRAIKAGAFEVIVDTDRWPELIKKVDINEQIPPDYAALNIYCYDFNNGIRKDLAQKKVEVEAKGVGGKDVTMRYTFRNDTPDIYACDLRFPYAVRIDVPYRYRITEITLGGEVTRSEWITGESWHRILDITSKSDNQTD